MSSIILPGGRGWFGTVSPREEEMPAFLKVIAQGWRTPKRKWEDLWRLRRGELNHVLGMRRFKFGNPKYQRGVLHPAGFWFDPPTGATTPTLTDITNYYAQVAPTPANQFYAYDSDGSMEWDEFASVITTNLVYVELTTGTDDTNDHTNEWWPDQPDVNEGLNWDIRYLNEVASGGIAYYFRTAGVNRTTATWYLLDTVSNDHGDLSANGAIGHRRGNGTAKSPNVGSNTLDVDVEIRATGTGSAVASHSFALTTAGT